MSDLRKAIFIDRDGVINKDYGYVHNKKNFEFINGVFEALNYIQKKNFLIIIITNQSGIGRGFFSIDTFLNLNSWMEKQFLKNGIFIDDTLFCPHSPDQNCMCRKPSPFLFLKAKEKFNIDMGLSWSFGDKESDITAAKESGVKNTVLVRSGQLIDEESTKAHFVVDSLINVKKLI